MENSLNIRSNQRTSSLKIKSLNIKDKKLSANEITRNNSSKLSNNNIKSKTNSTYINNYNLGDLVWAKIKNYPWWPAVVSY